ncbi:hypothetical protein CMI47_09570 [Candidatus Pacearchaeota archaeon]|nr:hypothetical protein [Candidatus Pacearchaeota archaeon]
MTYIELSDGRAALVKISYDSNLEPKIEGVWMRPREGAGRLVSSLTAVLVGVPWRDVDVLNDPLLVSEVLAVARDALEDRLRGEAEEAAESGEPWN